MKFDFLYFLNPPAVSDILVMASSHSKRNLFLLAVIVCSSVTEMLYTSSNSRIELSWIVIKSCSPVLDIFFFEIMKTLSYQLVFTKLPIKMKAFFFKDLSSALLLSLS